MRFEHRPGFVFFHDGQPRSYVTMSGPRGGMLPRGDVSEHSDAERRYAWAFEWAGELREGDQFVFEASDLKVEGEVRNGQIVVVPLHELLARPAAGVIVPRGKQLGNGARVMAIFPGVQSPGAGWNTLSHQSANNESAYMAHGMSYISAYLKSRGHHVWLLDTRGFRGWDHFAEEVRRQEYDFAMLGPLSIEAFTAACIVRILKEMHPRRPVIFGGLHVSMTKDKVFPPDDLPKFYFYQEPPSRMREYLAYKGESAFDPARWPKADYVVWNEGELATAAIVEGEDLKAGDWDYEAMPEGTVFLNGKIVPDLNKMPHMDRSLFNEEMEKQHPLLPELPAPFHTITFGRGCPYKCSFCFSGNTRVHTEYGFEKIKNVVQREEPVHIIQADGTTGTAVKFSERPYRGMIIRVHTHYMNQPIEATPNHRFFIQTADDKRTEKAAEDLTLGDRLFVPTPKGETVDTVDIAALLAEGGDDPQVLDLDVRLRDGKNRIAAQIPWSDDLLFLLGIYLAEGCVTYARKRPNSVAMAFSFGPHEEHLVEKTIHLLKKVFGVTSKRVRQRTDIQVWCGVSVVAKTFENLCGKHSDSKKLHRWLFGLSNERFLKIAAAWLIGDGNPGAKNHAHSYASGTTVSDTLAWSMWTRLLGCKVAASLRMQKRPEVCKVIEGRAVEVAEFYYEINFHHSEKSHELVNAAFGECGRLPSRMTFPLAFCDDGALLPIESLESAYWREPVFNLEVTPGHTYTANGCAVHNCSVGEQFSSTKVRLLEPDYFMDALHEMKKSNGGKIGALMVHDDILMFPTWLEDWNEKIKSNFGYIPYWAQMRADFICKHPKLIRHMAEAGMIWTSVGFEVGHARGLTGIMNKELKVVGIDDPVEINVRAAEVLTECGVNIFGNFMFGNPTETNEEMDATVRMIQRIRPQHHGFSTYCSYPGTAMERLVEAEGLRMKEWYTRSHYPWQYRLKGVDYDHVQRCIAIAAGTPKQYKHVRR